MFKYTDVVSNNSLEKTFEREGIAEDDISRNKFVSGEVREAEV